MSFDFGFKVESAWPDIMIDTETMGLRPDAPIIALGAAAFNLATMAVGPTFYANIDLNSTMALGAKPDGGTLMWWLTQSQEARDRVARADKMYVNEALRAFSEWLYTNCVPLKERKIWACGTDFDVVKLSEHYQRSSLEVPWVYYNARDQRTVRELWPEIAMNVSAQGVHHNALDDALYQIEILFAIRRHLASKGKL